MPFVYPDRPHERKHGPTGYTDYTTYKPWLRDEFHFRCVYCLERERWYPSGHAAFGVDHVAPKSDAANLARICDYANLVYACNRCNAAKKDRVLLDPCAATLAEHVRIGDDGVIAWLTAEGRRLVRTLGLDKAGTTNVRQRFLRIRRLYQIHPAEPEVRALYFDHFGFPDDLPNLDDLRPAGNSRPEGVNESFWRQRVEKRLPEAY